MRQIIDPSLELLHNFLVATVWFLALTNHLLDCESSGIKQVSSSLLFGLLLLLFSTFPLSEVRVYHSH